MILIDSNSICHQCKHAIGSLSWEDKKVGVIFGFIRQILILSKLFKTNQFVFVWDSRESLRIKMFPDYKKARRHEKSTEEKEFDHIAYDQFDLIRKEILPEIGFINNYMFEGYEADDLIASIVQTNKKESFVIVSTDEDLYQLLSDQVIMYSTRKKQNYTAINLWKDYKITPKEWGEVKAIAGCSTDGVPGVPHVAEVTASKYLNRKLSRTQKTFETIQNSEELIKRNRTLVVLPLKGTPAISLIPKENLDFKKFMTICSRYGFQSLLNKDTLQQWKEHIFKG